MLEPWIAATVCGSECATPHSLTMIDLLGTLQRFEANLDLGPERTSELNGLAASVCAAPCPNRFLTTSDVARILWNWLGSEGQPLIKAGRYPESVVIDAFFVSRLQFDQLRCVDACLVARSDLHSVMIRLGERGYLRAFQPGAEVPRDFIGRVPNWSRAQWAPTKQECLDQTGKPRYGTYDSQVVCVNPDLDPALRLDVARHEIGHYWQARYQPRSHDVEKHEAEADCFAALHGATQTFYEPSGCASEPARDELLDALAESFGLI